MTEKLYFRAKEVRSDASWHCVLSDKDVIVRKRFPPVIGERDFTSVEELIAILVDVLSAYGDIDLEMYEDNGRAQLQPSYFSKETPQEASDRLAYVANKEQAERNQLAFLKKKYEGG